MILDCKFVPHLGNRDIDITTPNNMNIQILYVNVALLCYRSREVFFECDDIPLLVNNRKSEAAI